MEENDNFPEWDYKIYFDMGVDETRLRLERVQHTITQAPPAGPTVNGSMVVGASAGLNQPILSFRHVTAPHVDVTVVNHFHQTFETVNYTDARPELHRGRGNGRGVIRGSRRARGGRGQDISQAHRVDNIPGPTDRSTDLAIDDLNEWPSLPAIAPTSEQ
jgi:hypothetical protein